ncbi:MAG: SipW-dependent-type signal peptide-containing protein [Candidatus Moranbacteria bacterium]|nr:SipW-dependent-type signal peptide-containing protein [Candidatus Moranbacteria bacterium]
MKKILFSLGVIGIVGVVLIGGTMSFFRDQEESVGNTFSAGEIDLKVDYQCDKVGCSFSERDLVDNRPFFSECDVKPGDSRSAAISWHVYNNNAWGRISLANLFNWENACTEPEAKLDATCGDPGNGQGELGKKLLFTLWMDEGGVSGWQCPTNQPACALDPQEGDKILDGVESVLEEDISADDIYALGWIVLPEEIVASNTYYLGIKWSLPAGEGNILQSDSISGKVVMQVVQADNNPDKIFP